ncbi:MAG: right-handed parallel beta-helix repeat-containing protein [Bacteroidales bacterium]|nr:right-handed parallel beta-helix repeat-containing protein [Bacteroidales bacterium]MBN2817455.1 right-handed parallel beta-helix repeat-containing protein [Bacteroidales bacterium]
MKHLPLISVTCFLFILSIQLSFSQTSVTDSLVSGTWTLSGSPYKVYRTVTIENNSTLIIEPGVTVVFQGEFGIRVNGRILAEGTSSDSILFTVNDTSGFYRNDSLTGGWNSVYFNYTPTGNDTSLFSYCRFEYHKGHNVGAVGLQYYSKVKIENSNFYHNKNLSDYYSKGGGAVSAYSSSPELSNNVFHNNYCQRYKSSNYTVNGGAISLNYSNSVLTNNRFFKNAALYNGDAISVYNSKIQSVGNLFYQHNGNAINSEYSKIHVVNNTFTDNQRALYIYRDTILIYNSIFFDNESTYGGDIYTYQEQGYVEINNSIIGQDYEHIRVGKLNIVYNSVINQDPLFTNATNHDYSLQNTSFAINNGINSIAGIAMPDEDLANNPRIYGSNVDIGAIEYLGTPVNRLPVVSKSVNNLSILKNTAEEFTINFLDSDIGDSYKINIESLTGKTNITNLSGNSTRSTVDFTPLQNWRGIDTVIISVQDNSGIIAPVNSDSVFIYVGDLFGTIDKDSTLTQDSVYIAGNVMLTKDNTLNIEAGCKLFFLNNFGFDIFGNIQAIGETGDSILFTSAEGQESIGWRRFNIFNSSNDQDTSSFRYCIFENARSLDGGGAFMLNNSSAAEFQNCRFSDNTNTTRYSSYGGGVFRCYYSYINIENCLFENNKSLQFPGTYYQSEGGVLEIDKSVAHISASVFENNTSNTLGGVLSSRQSLIHIDNSIFWKNSGNSAGTIRSYDSKFYVSNSTFADNKGLGRNFYTYDDSLFIQNCIFWGYEDSFNKNFQLNGNGNYVSLVNTFVDLKDYNYDLSQSSEWFYKKNVFYTDPYFIDGENGNFRLSDSSLCINLGTTDTSNFHISNTDAYGNPRFRDSIDIGAAEFAGTYVNRLPMLIKSANSCLESDIQFMEVSFIDTDPGESFTVSVTSDNEKVQIANISGKPQGASYEIITPSDWKGKAGIQISVLDNSGLLSEINTDSFFVYKGDIWGEISSDSIIGGDTIYVAGDVKVNRDITLNILAGTKVLFLDNFGFDIKGSIHAVGNSSDSIVFDNIQTDTTTRWKRFTFNDVTEQDSSVFKYCVFRNAQDINGGGAFRIYYSDSIYFSNCSFLNNKALTQNTNDGGGAIYARESEIKIHACFFQNNSASRFEGTYYSTDGGALDFDYCDGTITNCIFQDNETSESGGAINFNRSDMFISNSIFWNNKAGFGGAIGADYSVLHVSNCSFVENTGTGNNLYLYSDSLYIQNSIVWNSIGDYDNIYISGNSSYIYANNSLMDLSEKHLSSYNTYTYDAKNLFYTNPCFEDLINGNLRLSDSSYCINSGIADTSAFIITDKDVYGNPRYHDNIDIGATEFEGTVAARTPLLVKISNQMLDNENYLMEVNYFDDLTEIHTISVTSSSEHILIENISGDTTGSTYEIVTDLDWRGSGNIYVSVADESGILSDLNTDTFRVYKGDIWGEITADSTIGGDTIYVAGNTMVKNNSTLTILPGTTVLFLDKFKFSIDGRIVASGTPNDSIVFDGSWKGMEFTNTSGNTDTIIYEYCMFKNAELVENEELIATNSNNIIRIRNCTFENNSKITTQYYSPVVCAPYGSYLEITNSVFRNNKISRPEGRYNTVYSSILLLDYSNGLIQNNLFSNNSNEVYGTIYLYNCDMLFTGNFFDKNYSGYGTEIYANNSDVRFYNNTILSNLNINKRNTIEADNGGKLDIRNSALINNPGYSCLYVYEIESLNVKNSLFDTTFLNIIDVPLVTLENIITSSPYIFTSGESAGRLTGISPAIDAGSNSVIDSLLAFDMDMNSRVYGEQIDIGAFEFHGEKLQAIAGVKTIGGTNPDFTAIGEALSYLAENVLVDSITFLIRDGIYYEDINIENYFVPENGHITFKSESESPANVIIYDTVPGDDFMMRNGAVQLSNVNNFTLENVTVRRRGTAQDAAISIGDSCHNIHLISNIIIFDSTDILSGNGIHCMPMWMPSGDIVIRDNTIIDCGTAIYINGAMDGETSDVRIDSNKIENARETGIGLINTNSAYISANTIEVNSLIGGYGMYVVQCYDFHVFNNRISVLGDYGLTMNDVRTNLGSIYNNFISLQTGEYHSGYGLDINNVNGPLFVHNSVNLQIGNPSLKSSALHLTEVDSIILVNNIFKSDSSCIIKSDSSVLNHVRLDYNGYFNNYVPENNFATLGSLEIGSLPNWVSFTAHDSNSVFADPQFTSFTDLHVNNKAAYDSKGTGTITSSYDIDGEERKHNSRPDIGADEFTYTASIISQPAINPASNIVKCYPNPVSDILNIDSIHEIDNISLYSIEGRQILERDKVLSSSIILDLGSYENGIYLLNVVLFTGETVNQVIVVSR